MKRTRQHQIGTEAINAIKIIIPSTWVVNELKDDYGLDLMVEIVENEATTGNIFFIQAKGTDAEIKNDSFKYQLEYEHIKDYYNIPNPILFIVYSTKTNKFWGKWVNNLIQVIKLKKETQQSVTITFDKSNYIDTDFFQNLPSVFSIKLPYMVNITTSPTTALSKKIDNKLRKLIHHYYSDNVAFDNHLLALSINIGYQSIVGNNIKIEIRDEQGESFEDSVDAQHPYFNTAIFDENENCIPLKKAAIFISKLLYKVDINSTLDIITSNLDEVSDDVLSALELFQIIVENIDTPRIDFHRIRKLSQTIIHNKRGDLLQMINMAIILSGAIHKDHYSELYNENLLSGLKMSNDPNEAGAFCYNLANRYRNVGECYLASRFYLRARELEPDYLNRSYWWQEFAGVLFLCRHYKISEKFYKKALQLDPDMHSPTIYDLIADTLTHQGLFTEALEQYELYFQYIAKNNHTPSSLVLLKHIICKFIISNELDKPIDRDKLKMLSIEDFDESNLDFVIEEIKRNPLNTTNWFNVGITFSRIGEYYQAMGAFLVCWYFDENDDEALRNAFLMSFQVWQEYVLALILNVMYDKFGAQGFNGLMKEFYNQPDLNEEHKEMFAKILEEIYNSYAQPEKGEK